MLMLMPMQMLLLMLMQMRMLMLVPPKLKIFTISLQPPLIAACQNIDDLPLLQTKKVCVLFVIPPPRVGGRASLINPPHLG